MNVLPARELSLVSVIVPVHQAQATLDECLRAIKAGDAADFECELIVVDDGSTDESAKIAAGFADTVIAIEDGPRGPAHARNQGAVKARGDLLVFVDADVVVSRTSVQQFRTVFAADSALTAAFGAYDDAPRDPALVSVYRNLLHHYVHMNNAGAAVTFWSGLGAVRRSEFLAVGGFHAERFPRPQCEDIEFGYRLTDLGHRIELVPSVQGTHLKRWTLGRMLRTDLFDRAVPWMRMLLERGERENATLNVKLTERWLTLLAGIACALLLAGLLFRDVRWLIVALACIVCILLANARLLRWFASRRGVAFAVCAAGLRLLFYVVSGLGAAIALVTHGTRTVWPPPLPLMESSDHATA